MGGVESYPNTLVIIYVECMHAFNFVINQAALLIIFPMSLYYQNTRTRSGNFPNFLFVM